MQKLPLPVREAEFDPHYIRGNDGAIFAIVHSVPENVKEWTSQVIRAVNCHADLLNASSPFSFEIPANIPDDTKVGIIADIPVYAGEIRRLNAAIAKAEGKQ